MAGVNKVILIGNLGRDPEVRYTPSGQAVANFTVATNEAWTDKWGRKQGRTGWHRGAAWGKTAGNGGGYPPQGREVDVRGRRQTPAWTRRGRRNRSTPDSRA